MTHFNITHILPDDMLNLRAYHEVIDSVRWGLQQLGHHTTYSVNALIPDARNIVFGGQRAPELVILGPPDTIYYNLEQIRGHPQFAPDAPHPLMKFVASQLQVWEYSGANMPGWNGLDPAFPVRHVPIAYAPVLTRIESAGQQDIDILIYGSVGERRLAVLDSVAKLSNLGVSTVLACGLYGAGRDNLISRSKIVLNINHMMERKIFEVVRVSYLMANAKAVVADVSPDTYIEGDLLEGLILVPVEQIAETCYRLLADETSRHQLERNGFACIRRRDIRSFLASALA